MNLNMESDTNQNLLNNIEKISYGATLCGLDFKKLTDVQVDIKGISNSLVSHLTRPSFLPVWLN